MAKTEEQTMYDQINSARAREAEDNVKWQLEQYEKQLELEAKYKPTDSKDGYVFTLGGGNINVNLNIDIDSSMTPNKLQELLNVININNK